MKLRRKILLGVMAAAVVFAGFYVHGLRTLQRREAALTLIEGHGGAFVASEGNVSLLPAFVVPEALRRARHPVEGVHLQGAAFGDAEFPSLTALAEIKLLDLSGTRLSDGSADVLNRFEQLKDLNLSSTHVADRVASTALQSRSIRKLNLARTSVGDAALVYTPCCFLVERVDLEAAEATVVGARALLQKAPALEEVSFAGVRIGDEIVGAILDAPRLRKIDLSGNRLPDETLAVIAQERPYLSVRQSPE